MALADKLPCFPCPHGSACCKFGVSVTDGEAERIRQNYGRGAVEQKNGDWRTRASGKAGCVFCVENKCMLQETGLKPRLCFEWPRTEEEGRTLCPEFEQGKG